MGTEALISSNPQRYQRGATLIIVLIALVLLMVAAAALLRSGDTASLLAGNLALKRDSVVATDKAIERVIDLFVPTGALGTPGAGDLSVPALNYSATLLPADEHGIPLPLRDGGVAFEAVAAPAVNNIEVQGLTLSYLVERMCTSNGPASPVVCSMAGLGEDLDGKDGADKPGKPPRPVYRVTVRSSGPKDTSGYVQLTFSPN